MLPLTNKTTFRKIVAALATWLLILASVPVHPTGKVQAFFPTNLHTLGGIEGRSHTSITREAIKDLDAEFFSITKLTKPMKNAMENIADANAEVDKDQKTASKHFDGESFPEGQSRIIDRLDGVISALNNDNAAGARSELGAALHSIQDFYSHSNWIEMGNTGAHPGLGRRGASLNRLPAATATCQACTGGLPPILCRNCQTNLTTSQLTSGWYVGENAPFDVRPAGKCRHGGADGTLGFTEGINKDSFDCKFSPHNSLHAVAANAAIAGTKQFIRDIKDEVTPRQLKLLLGVGPTLAIAIDTTGSMGSIINSVKQQAIQIVNGRLGTDEEPSKYVLAPFNDPGVGPITVTTDPDAFKSAISSLGASGGGDCPELSQTGMLRGLAASDEGGDLFMFTDASSKDSGLAGNVTSLATSKDIRIYPILFGSCSPIDPSYIRVADESGGQVFFLNISEAGNITKLADFVVRSNAVTLLSIGDSLVGVEKTYTVPVDSTMSRVTFSVGGATSVTVKRPDGSTVQAADPNVSFLSLSGGAVYTIANPGSGNWSVTINGSALFSLTVSGEGVLDFSSFRFVEAGGRPGHEGYFPITGLPPAGEEGTVDAVLSGEFNTANFELRSKTGAALQALNLALVPETTDEFSGKVTPPSTAFLVYVTGVDSAGAPYQRVLSGLVKPQSLKITAPPSEDLRPGHTTSYTFQVKNLGAADSFQFSGSDDKNFLSSISQTTFTLAANETKNVTVQLNPPGNAPIGSSDTLTASVRSTTTTTNNFAVVVSTVGSPQARTTTTVTSSANPSAFGESLIFKATVASAPGSLTGTVQFKDNGIDMGSPQTVNASGEASISVSSLALGNHAITGDYSGDPNFSLSAGELAGGQVVVSTIVRFSSATYDTTESSGSTTITVKRDGDKSQAATLDYVTADDSDATTVVSCATINGLAAPRCDYTTVAGTLRFAAGEATKTFTILISQDNYVEGPETMTISLTNPTGGAFFGVPSTATLTIADDASEPATNPIDDSRNFVRQNYHDFLNREPDDDGLTFWTGEIDNCTPKPQCTEVKRINVSAAFFLSIEFKETGYLVERIYKASYGDVPGMSNLGGAHQVAVPVIRFNDFLADTQRIGQNVVVGAANWPQQLEQNKLAFTAEFVRRSRFTTAYPVELTPTQFVDALFLKTGITPSLAERQAAIDEFGTALTTADTEARARALRRVAENAAFAAAEFNRTFVLIEYFGYLRRNPDAAPDMDFTGRDFWLAKLNSFNGNFVAAEMVKAFLASAEYRKRFGS
jgi:hypothetical protein